MALLGFAALALAGSGVVFFFVVELDGLRRGLVEITPAVQRVVEFFERTLEHGFWPGRREPRSALGRELVFEHAQHCQATLVGFALGSWFGELIGQLQQQGQLLGFFHVEQVANAATQLFAGFG